MPYRNPQDPLYTADRFLYLWAGPVAIAAFGILGATTDTPSFFGSLDLLGRLFMVGVVIGAAFTRWRPARVALFFVMSGAFIGRAAALISVGGSGLNEAAEIRGAAWYLFVWVVSVAVLFQTDIIRTWDKHRG